MQDSGLIDTQLIYYLGILVYCQSNANSGSKSRQLSKASKFNKI